MRRDAGHARVLTLYTRDGCHLCEDARATLERLRTEIPFEVRECDIAATPELLHAYFDRIPVVSFNGVELCDCVVDEEQLREALL